MAQDSVIGILEHIIEAFLTRRIGYKELKVIRDELPLAIKEYRDFHIENCLMCILVEESYNLYLCDSSGCVYFCTIKN